MRTAKADDLAAGYGASSAANGGRVDKDIFKSILLTSNTRFEQRRHTQIDLYIFAGALMNQFVPARALNALANGCLAEKRAGTIVICSNYANRITVNTACKKNQPN